MSAPVNRELILRLLQDDSLSFRSIARQAQCSDFAVRAIAHKIEDSDPSDDPPAEPLTARDWCIGAGVVICIFGGMWLLSRNLPLLDGAM